jgi:cyclopropane-fatty-acyl-phospholipid synthase
VCYRTEKGAYYVYACDMKTLNLSIPDMICDDCAGAVKKTLKRIPGVCHVNVSLSPSSVTLYYLESNQELQTIAQMVNHNGHIDLRVLMPQHKCSHTNNRTIVGKNRVTKHAEDLLTRLFSNVKSNIRLRLCNGEALHIGHQLHDQEEPCFTLAFHSMNAIKQLVLGRDPLRLAEAYFRGEIDIEGDFFAAIRLKDDLQTINLSLTDKIAAIYAALSLPKTSELSSSKLQSLQFNPVKAHSKTENREAIAYHYDVSNDFYALWLDKAMIYSCAYFDQVDATLEQAQFAKLNHICRKLQLKPNDKLLDIGCGWGALVIHAAKFYGATAHGITLSQRQFELASQRITEAGLQDKVSVELRDYRDLKGEGVYDKISSIGMFEHIGLKNLPLYFATVNRLLKPTGLFLNHGITHYEEGWHKTLSTEFINRYVFPDGQLDTVSNIQLQMERAKFEIADVEALRQHYALTLRHWVAGLEQHHEQALQYVSEATYRIWRLYMAACALDFETGELGVYQILASKNTSVNVLPLTRQHLYPSVAQVTVAG